MSNVRDEQIIANFEELLADDQIPTAVDLLVDAEPDEQLALIEHTSDELLTHLVQALPVDERAEMVRHLADPARQRLERILGTDGAAPVSASDALVSPRRSDFAIADGHLVEASPAEASVTVFANPTGQEQRALIALGGMFSGIDDHTLASALDPDEVSRLEHDEVAQSTIMVWKRPTSAPTSRPQQLRLSSMGIFVHTDHLVIVTADDEPVLEAGDRANSLLDLLLRVLDGTANEFLLTLKTLKRTAQSTGKQLSYSMNNRGLLRMFNLSEGLVYHIDAMEANAAVLRRLRILAPRLGFETPDTVFLDDIIIDTNQCIRQGQILSEVLGGLMDARGNIINNNMTVLLKNLTLINVVFLPLGVLASIGGMSEFSRWLEASGIAFGPGYATFTVGMILFGLFLWAAVRLWTGWSASR